MGVCIRVIPCLDVAGGKVVKGVNFRNLREVGDPVELAQYYSEQGADELVFLDISASVEGRNATKEIVKCCADKIFIPLCVGGGIKDVSDVDTLLRCGADKIGINTGAIIRPQIINEISNRFGNQVVVLSLDVQRENNQPSGFGITTYGGRTSANLDALEWAKEAEDRGAGEILLNSMDTDGTVNGFDIELIKALRAQVNIPIIASGGAGKVEDFALAVQAGADAVLAASIFHHGSVTIEQVKKDMKAKGIEVR